jgi:hypothetical protein
MSNYPLLGTPYIVQGGWSGTDPAVAPEPPAVAPATPPVVPASMLALVTPKPRSND